jgi:hypothetical protein
MGGKPGARLAREQHRDPQSGAVDSGLVKRWTSRVQFFSGNDAELTRHYAMAKEEVRLWLQKSGHSNLYDFLERIRLGDGFVEIYEEKGRETSPSRQ